MKKETYFDANVKAFLDIMHEPSDGIASCDASVARAFAVIAEDAGLIGMSVVTETPKSKVFPDGAHHETGFGKILPNAPTHTFTYDLLNEIHCAVTLYAADESAFLPEALDVLDFLFCELAYKYNRENTQKLIYRILNTDLFTGVLNQNAFMQMAAMLLQKGLICNYSVLFFNIHNFKYVNKVFPYAEGDVILIKYANLVQSFLQKEEAVARLGGDNFVMLVHTARTQEIIEQLQHCRIYHKALGKEKEFLLGATIGAAELAGISTPRDVMLRASIAYQVARANGAGSLAFYSEELHKHMMERQSVLSNFLPALALGEFIAYYQPKVDIKTRRVCGAEALVRWVHEGKVISPAMFVPVLEQEDAICQLDYYILEKVCAFQKKRLEAGEPIVCISVNFSRRHLDEEDLAEHIVSVIDSYGINHAFIEIEITESEDFQNYEKITSLVEQLRKSGIGTSMDDFGTGFSSLNMIRKVDLSVIKIDRSFIPREEEYEERKKDEIMFEELVSLIRQLGKRIVVEGVETKSQLDYVASAGCSVIQGFVFDKPLPGEEFAARISQVYE